MAVNRIASLAFPLSYLRISSYRFHLLNAVFWLFSIIDGVIVIFGMKRDVAWVPVCTSNTTAEPWANQFPSTVNIIFGGAAVVICVELACLMIWHSL